MLTQRQMQRSWHQLPGWPNTLPDTSRGKVYITTQVRWTVMAFLSTGPRGDIMYKPTYRPLSAERSVPHSYGLNNTEPTLEDSCVSVYVGGCTEGYDKTLSRRCDTLTWL